MDFFKMHGCGNDYIFFDCYKFLPEQLVENIENIAQRLSQRHFSIGSDGIVLMMNSEIADAKMRMFNKDGSEGKMCGNAIRCLAKLLFDLGYVKSKNISIETLSGIKKIKLQVNDGKCVGARVNMGKQILNPADIPCNISKLADDYKTKSFLSSMPYLVDDEYYSITTVNMGNPHCVVFCDFPISSLELDKIGPKFERLPLFIERVNTEFVNIVSSDKLEMRVWERGSGETLACGTGACAVAVASVLNGICDSSKPILVKLQGGVLKIELTADGVFMTGPAEIAFKGEVGI